MELPAVVLGFGLEEGLGAIFGTCVILWAIWCLYQWEIKPTREARRRRAQKQVEENHRIHWQRRQRTDIPRN